MIPMYKILAFGIIVGASSLAIAADLPDSTETYSTDLKLKIATAISPRSPPVRTHLTRSGGARPIIHGTTSLPDGAILQIIMRKPWLPDGQARLSAGLPACRNNCGPLMDRVMVKNGAFQMGPFSDEPLDPGVYEFELIVERGVFGPDEFHKFSHGQIVIGSDDR
jgi:hypothetical protein